MSNINGLETVPQVSREIIAHDFQNTLSGKLDNVVIDTIKKEILSATTAYPAICSFIDSFFYLQLQITITNGKTFNGHASGSNSIGTGGMAGQVNTNDIDRLYADTVSMQLLFTIAYSGVAFYDKDANFLGIFIGPAVGVPSGSGSGPGSWS
ncbi:VapA/VapB family virulence-associated protein [Flavobacterium sp. H122]|uniref:VapA/VapB family virulence-associated protein n=1 Tax=Flavobacterium sp. H122 TaxID=2529860 RepID=UPI0010A996BA|nr:VapA/VapB family virulence-associated protein [Flavobacterium sp. H122]